MGQYYTKGLCPKCLKPTLTIWPAVPGGKPRKTCGNVACKYVEGG